MRASLREELAWILEAEELQGQQSFLAATQAGTGEGIGGVQPFGWSAGLAGNGAIPSVGGGRRGSLMQQGSARGGRRASMSVGPKGAALTALGGGSARNLVQAQGTNRKLPIPAIRERQGY